MSRKPILCLDFDGVLHSYTSGWKGAAVIPDPPVPGALAFVVGALERFQVAILSSRSHQWGGKRAMKAWLRKHLIATAGNDFSDTPEWWRNRISQTAFADPWKDEVSWAADLVVRAIQWPWFKPPATVTLDDRALTFRGQWPTLSDLAAFKPWTGTLHASAPHGYKCSDCAMDGEPCPQCYEAAWRKRHPNTAFV